MQEKKISINIFYNILNQIVSFIVPLILSPYVARVLSAELIGDYSYALANSCFNRGIRIFSLWNAKGVCK